MPNDFSALTPSIIAGVQDVLRSTTRLPALVNGDYNSNEAQQIGDTINVPLPPTVGTRPVVTQTTPITPVAKTPRTVPIPIDQWQQSDPIFITDKEVKEADRRNIIPPGLTAGVESLMSEANQFLFNKYKGVFGYYGPDLAKVPFQQLAAVGDEHLWATQAQAVLNIQKCPSTLRRGVISDTAHSFAIGIPAFRDISQSGSATPLTEAEIGQRFGINWFRDNDVPVHTAGTAEAATVTLISDSSVGDETVTLKVASGTATLVEGDIFTITGDTQTYVAGADVTLTTGGVSVGIQPPLKVAVDGSGTPVVSDVKGSHKVHLLFHRDAFAFVNRPLGDDESENSKIQTIVDPVTGLTIRLETARQQKQRAYELDILYGAALIRPELAMRIAGAPTG